MFNYADDDDDDDDVFNDDNDDDLIELTVSVRFTPWGWRGKVEEGRVLKKG